MLKDQRVEAGAFGDSMRSAPVSLLLSVASQASSLASETQKRS